MIPRTGRFRRADRLLTSRDFDRVGREGGRRVSRDFVMLAAPGRDSDADGRSRLGVTVSRRVGNAVIRNRVKRRIREWFRRSRGHLSRSLDIVVIARAGARGLQGDQVGAELDALMRQMRTEGCA